ncbi:DNA-dependent helicase II [Acetonema longum DSM 6540]|uniref:DNA-dependent helicase II n=2 Tax=Acetonema TaxID=2373 RepID=F7NKG8_9FIRM|nr:DNA-dependent helicase II [Acetonema longum DSM 6540]
MHNLFMYICKEIGIRLFIVGDIKQSIYGWRGGYVKGFKSIIADTKLFKEFKLKHNFRSNVPIQNYSNLFMDDVRDNYQKSEFNNEIIGFAYRERDFASSFISKWLDLTKNCAFLVRKNDDADVWSQHLQSKGINFIYLPASPLDNSNLESEHIWIARTLAFYLIQDRFSEYDVIAEIPSSDAFSFKKIKQMLSDLKSNTSNLDEFSKQTAKFYEYLGYTCSEKTSNEIQELFSVINNPIYIPTYNPQKYNHVITTIHSAKGLEYSQIIIQAGDFNLANVDDKYLHYVAVSRPEDKLLVLIDYSLNNGRNYIRVMSQEIEKTNLLGFDIKRDDVIKGINSSEFITTKS